MMIKIEFEEQVWNKVVELIMYAPGREANPIANAIMQQLAAQRDGGGDDNVSKLRQAN